MRSLVAAAVAAALVVATPVASRADSVQVLQGPGVTANAWLTYVPCDSFFGASSAPQVRINLGPGAAPLGRRSVGLVPPASGTASGPVVRMDSVATQSAAVAVHATGGTAGAAYVWLSSPDAPLGHAWAGRADVPVGVGAWQTVDAHALTFRWQLHDLLTGRPVADAGAATIGGFTAAHGDGPGFVVLGFGCDGRSFNLDAVRAAGTTLDYEGIDLTTTIGAPATSVAAGARAVVTGVVRSASGRVTGDPLVLQERRPGAATWRDVSRPTLSDPDGVSRVEVVVEETTEYRWFRPEGQYADAGWSDSLVIEARSAQPSPSPTQLSTPTQTEKPSPTPTEKPSPTPTEEPSPTPTEEPTPTQAATPTSTETATPAPTTTETATRTATPTPTPTETATPAPTPEPTTAPVPAPESPSTEPSGTPTP
ncbi:hypothetical protein [Nocardioides gansuensis]|uniref:hypothetical protein n=1 Tax=Nocardioides gansuensis TaxID=2138300 RepID=UPI001057D34A|nr:hypothetical protein [Nocardioides gansuensis]